MKVLNKKQKEQYIALLYQGYNRSGAEKALDVTAEEVGEALRKDKAFRERMELAVKYSREIVLDGLYAAALAGNVQAASVYLASTGKMKLEETRAAVSELLGKSDLDRTQAALGVLLGMEKMMEADPGTDPRARLEVMGKIDDQRRRAQWLQVMEALR